MSHSLRINKNVSDLRRAVKLPWKRAAGSESELRPVYPKFACDNFGPGSPLRRANDAALELCIPPAPARGVAIDLGCGAGRHLVLLHARGWERVFGFDLLPEALRYASGYSGRAVADLRRIPARPVELVLCSMVLGQLARLEPALDALTQLVRYRGHLVISDVHPRAIEAGVAGSKKNAKALRRRRIDALVNGIQSRGLAVQLVTEPAPEPPLPREPELPRVPLCYALCARRVVG